MKLGMIFAAIAGWMIFKNLQGIIGMVFICFLLITGIIFYRNFKSKVRLRKSGIDDIDSMEGLQFEHYLKELFLSRGYKVKMTATTGDFGADLILSKEDRRIVVQAKRYSKAVGIKAVQEVIAAVKMYGATEAWVVTNSGFTKAAVELAGKHEVKLIDRYQLITLINQLSPQQNPNPSQIKREIKPKSLKKCEKCGSDMLIRKGPRGIFYGCSSFPKCRHTSKAK